MYSLPFDDINSVLFKKSKKLSATQSPVIKNLDQLGDTYLDMSDWGKGCVWANGHHLGRYWKIGPQQTLYLPVEWLKKGQNEVVVLELIKPQF